MPAPVANFKFSADTNDLSVQFTDGSSGIITSWAWDFGFKDNTNSEVVSPQQNPLITFPANGVYQVSLTVTNGSGTNTFTFPIVLSGTPNINIPIRQMVQYDLPIGLALDSIGFQQAIQKWMLFLQPAANILDANVFLESYWPPLFRILIAKLVIYEMIMKAAVASMTSYISAAESYNQLASSTTTETIQVSDYTIALDQSYPLTVNLVIANGVNYGPSPGQANLGVLLTWLNSLGIGGFAVSGGNLVSLGNQDILTTFNYTAQDGGHNGAFIQSNSRVIPLTIPVTQPITGGIGAKGPLKQLDTGPSKAQWYDSSQYWLNIFKTPDANGSGGGLMTGIAADLCMFANRLTIKLPMCPAQNSLVKVPLIGRSWRRRNHGPWPASNERASDWFWGMYYP